MKIFLCLAASSLALAASTISADAVSNNKPDDLSNAELKEYLALQNFHSRLNDIDLEDLDLNGGDEMNRMLEGGFTLPPEPTGSPTSASPPPQCGDILTKTGYDMELGPFASRDFACNTGSSESTWYTQSFSYPLYKYGFQLTMACEYQFRTPEGNHEWQTVRDVNTWFEQMARTVQRVGHSGYKASDDNVIFTGYDVPSLSDVTHGKIEGCPEEYCVQLSGAAIGLKEFGGIGTTTSALTPTLVYAFSNENAYEDFWLALDQALRSEYSEHIFKTNHFLRCGCESFCFDKTNEASASATCYIEEQCGQPTFQIAYPSAATNAEKVSWEATGTTRIMEWFSACADSMFGCKPHGQSKPLTDFAGTSTTLTVAYPLEYEFDPFLGEKFVYGLGGGPEYGFLGGYDGPEIFWSCPSVAAMTSLKSFGGVVQTTNFMQDAGLTSTLPTPPCEPEIINPPEEPELPPSVGPGCTDVQHNGNCIQLPGGTCYTRTPNGTCPDVELVFESNEDGVSVFTDSNSFMKKCISSGSFCDLPLDDNGQLSFMGSPLTRPAYVDNGWQFIVSNKLHEGMDTYSHQSAFECQSWECAYGAANFTFFMDQAELYTIDQEACTDSPTNLPSESPTLSLQPSGTPTMAPTYCAESYLDSEHLNINLVVDLSRSTVRTSFSSDVDIGDVNGDTYSNTILDAQVLAIEELLKSIRDSESLNNDNCEIHLISFDTDAIDHGSWGPLNIHGTGINNFLMSHIKNQLRAPYKPLEQMEFNRGYTNFDGALDASVEYFTNVATPHRLNLLVFLSDGVPNVRGDGDNEVACVDAAPVWFDTTIETVNCGDLNLVPGEPHTFCRGGDSKCAQQNQYQDCVRGDYCENTSAALQYDSEIAALNALNVQRLAIGVGAGSDVQQGSGLWMIDDNPGKISGVLPVQALDFEALSSALKNLCILNTEPPTRSPTTSPSVAPTKTTAPSDSPTVISSTSPTKLPSNSPTAGLTFKITSAPTISPSGIPSTSPSSTPSGRPTQAPTTSEPSTHPSGYPTRSPSASPSVSPSGSPTPGPTLMPSTSPTTKPSDPPSESPSGSFFPSLAPTDSPTTSPAPSGVPTGLPSVSPSFVPSPSPSASPTKGPTVSPSPGPSTSPSPRPTTSPSSGPTTSPTVVPTTSPSISPTISHAPTFLVPECFEEPKLISKYSSQQGMCYFNPDMVQINEMNAYNAMDTTTTKIQINNVWTQRALPDQLRVFVHTNGVNSVQNNRDGFECLSDEGEIVNMADDSELTLECYKDDDGPWLAVIDVIITDANIPSNDVPHPCDPEFAPISNSCAWRVVIPCDPEDLCSADPTTSPSASPSSEPTPSPTGLPSASPSSGPTYSPTDFPTASPTGFPSIAPSNGPTATDSGAPSESPTTFPTATDSGVPTESPTAFPTYTDSGAPSESPSIATTIVETSRYPVEETVSAPTGSPTAATSLYPVMGETSLYPVMGETSLYPVMGETSLYPVSLYPVMGETSLDPVMGETSLYPVSLYPVMGETSLDPVMGETSISPVMGETPSTGSPTYSGTNEEEEMYCPDDLTIVQTGVTTFPTNALVIKNQNTTTVTVELTQAFTSSQLTIDSIYYQYQVDNFDRKCYEKDDVTGGKSLELTLTCTHHSQLALLEVWIADALTKNTLHVGDNAVVPECCHPSYPEGTPVTKYLLEIKCVTKCVSDVA